jgi:hypothetical protein
LDFCIVSQSFLLSALLLLAMLASAAHAARSIGRWSELIWLVAPFGIALLVTRMFTVQMEFVGAAIAIMAAWRLVRGGGVAGGLLLAGLTAGFGAALYAESGMPLAIAAGLPLGATLLAVLFARDQRFATIRARDFVLLTVAWSAPIIAAAPSVLAGWTSAHALNHTSDTAETGFPVWAWLVPLMAMLIGGARGFWKRR